MKYLQAQTLKETEGTLPELARLPSRHLSARWCASARLFWDPGQGSRTGTQSALQYSPSIFERQGEMGWQLKATQHGSKQFKASLNNT